MSAGQFFAVASNMANIAPGVAALVLLVEAIHDTVHNMKRNNQQCAQLADFCKNIVATIDANLKETGVADNLEKEPRLQESLLAMDKSVMLPEHCRS